MSGGTGIRQSGGMRSVEEHLQKVLERIRPLPAFEQQLLDAHGHRLAEDVYAPRSVPLFDNSAMDGYAVRHIDVQGADEQNPAVLTVSQDIAAGAGMPAELEPGACARIMTGAPVPPGADAVVPVEWTDGWAAVGGAGRGDGGVGDGGVGRGVRGGVGGAADGGGSDAEAETATVRIFREPEPGMHIRRRGEDVETGQLLLKAGTDLGARQIGLLAAVGIDRVPVRPSPRIVIISTGAELVEPGTEPAPGQIPDANGFTLTAAAREAGATAFRVGTVADDVKSLLDTIEDQLIRADLVVTTGGVSVGAYDVVKEALRGLGTVEFGRVAMQPGMPQGFGVVGQEEVPIFTLPGNPVSAYIGFEMFVRPAIRTMLGYRDPADLHRPTADAVCVEGFDSPEDRTQFLRGVVGAAGGGGRIEVRPAGGAGSHLMGGLAQANSLIVVPVGQTRVEPGELVQVVLLADGERDGDGDGGAIGGGAQ
ncbi:MAG TPA: gephyrin-like molybdotransferase Glp [Actinocrinis sp.]|jgi:molybdopterin molybdotransferase